MRTLALNDSGDLAISAGRLQLVSGVAAIRQQVQMRLRFWAGEWFADTSVGVPWGSILGAKGAQAFAEATLRRAIETTPGVIAPLERFVFTFDGARRSATVDFRARTTTGEALDFTTVTDFTATGARA